MSTPPLRHVESMTFDVEGTPYVNTASNGIPVEGTYTVSIWRYERPWTQYKVYASGGGNELTPITCETLREARKQAGRRATVLRSTSEELVWAGRCP